MNGTPSSVLTMGLGAWGGPSLIVTLGYGIGAAAAIQSGRIEVTVGRQILGYRVESSRLEITPIPQRLDYGAKQ